LLEACNREKSMSDALPGESAANRPAAPGLTCPTALSTARELMARAVVQKSLLIAGWMTHR